MLRSTLLISPPLTYGTYAVLTLKIILDSLRFAKQNLLSLNEYQQAMLMEMDSLDEDWLMAQRWIESSKQMLAKTRSSLSFNIKLSTSLESMKLLQLIRELCSLGKRWWPWHIILASKLKTHTYYAQANGQVGDANNTIIYIIKKRIEENWRET